MEEQQMKTEPLVYDVDDDSEDDQMQQEDVANGEDKDNAIVPIKDDRAAHLSDDVGLQAADLGAQFRDWAFGDDQAVSALQQTQQIQFPVDADWPSMVAPTSSAVATYQLSPADQKRVCKICLGRYSTDSALKSHMLVHTGERRHRCVFCNKWFKLKHHLHRHVLMHVRIHTRKYGRALVCIGCQTSFDEDIPMAKHMSHCHAIRTGLGATKDTHNGSQFVTFLGTADEDVPPGQDTTMRAPRLKMFDKQGSPTGGRSALAASPSLLDAAAAAAAADSARKHASRYYNSDPTTQSLDDSCMPMMSPLHSPTATMATSRAPAITAATSSNTAYLQQAYNVSNAGTGYATSPVSQVTSSGGFSQRIIGTNTITGTPIVESSQRPSHGMAQSPTCPQVASVRSLPCYNRTLGTQTVESGICSDQFTCPACNIDFKENALYLMHKTLHGPESPWQCSQCQESFPDKYGFMAHLLNRMSHN
ncbi:PREDICTED: zinc finger protein 236-like [Priapulus caudatus]|uniref:Zinc finger protein 236-like n=1 Tax=Priapulus caudatus TaxID=37621 RepID=A0ABM1E261_PRICU|nr:PREDICTED: zinc finger protein 236-like [Priapulus caudatus]